jgi:hypothetical protein
MKKIISALSLTGYLSLASSAFAQTTVNACAAGQFGPLCNLTTASFGPLVGTLIQLIFAIAVIVALFYLVWGGFKWLTSGGDKGAVQQAREHIVAAIIGLVIIFLSYFLLNILLGFFGVGSLNAITLPRI